MAEIQMVRIETKMFVSFCESTQKKPHSIKNEAFCYKVEALS